MRSERGEGNIHFPCSANHKQDWQPCSFDPSLTIICKSQKIQYYSEELCLKHSEWIEPNAWSIFRGADFYNAFRGGPG